jgi:preprotein translocase subunit SecF
MRWRRATLGLALVAFVASLAIIGLTGFNYALEVTGGTVVEARFDNTLDVDAVRKRLETIGYGHAEVQTFGGGSDVLVRLQPQGGRNNADGDKTVANIVVKAIGTAENPAHLLRTEFVGPQVGKDLAWNGLYATIFMLAGFLFYIAFRFELKFAIVASITAFLDLIVTVAYVSATGREFDLTVLAGLLSVMGFAINDIIVVFDRVRENFRGMRAQPLEVLNKSINQTLSRTIITAVMFFLSAWALYLYGGESMQGLAETHMIGAVVGVVSAIVVAVPMLAVRPFAVTKQDLMPKAKDEAALARRP